MVHITKETVGVCVCIWVVCLLSIFYGIAVSGIDTWMSCAVEVHCTLCILCLLVLPYLLCCPDGCAVAVMFGCLMPAFPSFLAWARAAALDSFVDRLHALI